MTTDNFWFYLQNRLIQTSQTGGQRYSETSPLSIPWFIKYSHALNVWPIAISSTMPVGQTSLGQASFDQKAYTLETCPYNIHREHRSELKYRYDFTTKWVQQIFTILVKIFVTHLKHSSFQPSADVNPMLNGLVHAMPWQCMFALSMPQISKGAKIDCLSFVMCPLLAQLKIGFFFCCGCLQH